MIKPSCKRGILAILLCAFAAGNVLSAASIPVHCRYLDDPDLMKEYIAECADFWRNSRDSVHGGYYTWVDRAGNPAGTKAKSFMVQTRHAYGFVRAFMVTGDEQYLAYARHALDYLYAYGWDSARGGWYFSTDETGNLEPPYGTGWDPNTYKWSFTQHYALLGILASYEATGNAVDLLWLEKGVAANNAHLWDSRPSTRGYYERADLDWSSPSGKGFTPTVDAMTTHAFGLYLATGESAYRERLLQLADQSVDRLCASMTRFDVRFGFAELYDSNWVIDGSVTQGDVGHVLKTSWCLARAYLLEPDSRYRRAARDLFFAMWDKGGYDHEQGGPYMTFDWKKGGVTSTDKDYWMLEQAVTAGLVNYYIAENFADAYVYLKMADESLDFYMAHLVDPVYGETYSQTYRDGTMKNDAKSDPFKGGYHSIELGYYVYLYGNLFYKREPVSLYYKVEQSSVPRTISLTPVELEDERLVISEVTLDGQPFSSFNAQTRAITLAPVTGGVLKVTFVLADTGGREAPVLHGTFTVMGGAKGYVQPARGEVATLILRPQQEGEALVKAYTMAGDLVWEYSARVRAGHEHVVRWDCTSSEGENLAAGIYLLHVSGAGIDAKKKVAVMR